MIFKERGVHRTTQACRLRAVLLKLTDPRGNSQLSTEAEQVLRSVWADYHSYSSQEQEAGIDIDSAISMTILFAIHEHYTVTAYRAMRKSLGLILDVEVPTNTATMKWTDDADNLLRQVYRCFSSQYHDT